MSEEEELLKAIRGIGTEKVMDLLARFEELCNSGMEPMQAAYHITREVELSEKG